MKALVAVKRVVDYAVKVRAMKDMSGVDIKSTKMSINPFCEIAVEEAIRMREKKNISEIIAVSCGPKQAEETLRHAMAMGADRSILLRTDLRPDIQLQPLAVAKLLKEIVLKESPMIVVLGKQAIDDDSNMTGQMLAAMLGWPQATFASSIEFSSDKTSIDATREVDAGLQTLTLKLPAVVTCDLRLNTPRYATLPNLMKAKKKLIEVVEAASLGVPLQAQVNVTKVFEPEKRKGGVMVQSVDELIDKLRNEAKVL